MSVRPAAGFSYEAFVQREAERVRVRAELGQVATAIADMERRLVQCDELGSDARLAVAEARALILRALRAVDVTAERENPNFRAAFEARGE